MAVAMKAEIGILCALREHVSYLLSVSTPLVRRDGCWLVERNGRLLALAHQGRTDALSYENAARLIRLHDPQVMFTFGPAALVAGHSRIGQWHEIVRCAALGCDSTWSSALAATDSGRCAPADLLVSAERFVANAGRVERIARRAGAQITLLDMTGCGVARACAEAGVAWKHFRWTTDRAGDTAVPQFVWNVRGLAKRGHEVLQILEEVLDESCVAV